MKTIIKSAGLRILLVLTIILSAQYAQAQQQRPQGPPPIPNEKQVGEMVDRMSGELKLTESQHAAILKLHTTHFNKVRSLTEDARSAERQEMEKLRTEFEKEVKSVLSAEQQKKFDAFRKAHDPRGEKPQGPPK